VAGGDKSDLALARAIANAKTSINDAMDTIQQSLDEQVARKPRPLFVPAQHHAQRPWWRRILRVD
jgi:hypothetical protein